MLAELAVNLLASAVLLVVGYLLGMYRERRLREGRNLEDYDFYPFGVDDTGRIYFDEAKFVEAVDHFLHHRDHVAARQLILVGEQNEVRHGLPTEDRERSSRTRCCQGTSRSSIRSSTTSRPTHGSSSRTRSRSRIRYRRSTATRKTSTELALGDLRSSSRRTT